jgi:hypothetical protein
MISLAQEATAPSSPNAVSAVPRHHRAYAVSLAAAAAVTVGVTLVAFTRLLLYAFYVRGSFLLDVGLFADLLWHSDPVLTQPSSVGGGSYFAVHATPLFLPIAMLSRLLPLSLPQFFALVIAVSQMLLARSVFWMVVAADRSRKLSTPWLAASAGLGFAFSGLAIAITRYPHSEPLIAAFFLLFITALGQNRHTLAVILFACGLLVREDAGLHYLAVLGLMIALDALRGRKPERQRVLVMFASAGLLYSGAAMVAERIAFPAHASSFSLVYLGNPPLAHLTASSLRSRLLYFVGNRSYIWVPGCVVGIWAKIARAPFLAIGYLACLPWLALQLLAASPFAAALASYYAFPCLIGMAWPLVAVLYGRAGSSGQIGPLLGFGVIVLTSFLPGHDIHDPGRLPVATAFLSPVPSRAEQADIDYAVMSISKARPLFGRLLVDNSVVALNPDAFSRDEVETTPGMGGVSIDRADTVVFFADGYDAAHLRAVADASRLTNRYVIRGTPIHIASYARLAGAPGLAGLIVPE